MRRVLAALVVLSLSAFAGLSLAPPASATSPISGEDELVRNATHVFARAVNTPAAAIPAAVLMRASAIAVVPAAARDGGVRYHGKGVVSARGARPDYWTPPAIFTFEGAIPLDLEADVIDFVFIAQSRRGLDWLVEPRTTSTAARAMAAGGLGHNTPVRIDADLLAYMQFENYFAGVTVDDWIVQEMTESNRTLYGRPYSTDEILRGVGFFRVPPAARMWRDVIASYYRDMS